MINMKKLIVILLSVILCVSYLAAREPNQLIIVAYDGISGIPVGTNYYHAAAGGSYLGTGVVKDETNKDSIGFTDNEMIGLIQFYYYNSSYYHYAQDITMDGKIRVTVTCPNGFYLTSQSNPNYKRPFQILVRSSWNGGTSQLITEDSPTIDFDINNNDGEFHLDVVISLPGETNNTTKECTVTTNGKSVIYSLNDLDDYSAVVTFDVEYLDDDGNVIEDESGNALKKSVTLPFSGYYDSSVNNPQPSDDAVSMNIIMNSEAYNIDIKNKRGVWIPIGELYFNLMIGKAFSTEKKAAIFFSSSENPDDTNAKTFTMVHDDVGATTPLTSQNSIGFTLRTVDMNDSSSVKTFNGNSSFDENKTSDYIYFSSSDLEIDYMYTYYAGYRNQNQVRSYYRYAGRIEIMLDNNDITMHEGRYTETIYVHVMVYQ